MPHAIGAPRCGVPSVITSLTLSRHGSSPTPPSATAPAARMTSPPSECPTSAIRVTGTGQPSTTRWTSAVSAAPFSRSGSPVLARSMSGVQPRPASISAYVVPVRSRCRWK